MTVYIDKFLLINFLMNFFILHITKAILKSGVSSIKTALCSTAGAVFALIVFLPLDKILIILAEAVFSAIVLIICFCGLNAKKLIRAAAVFYSVAFLCGGCAVGVSNYFNVRGRSELTYILLVSVALSYFLLSTVSKVYERIKTYNNLIGSLKIYICGKCAETDAFCDTGNHLSDPVSGLPVVVVSAAAVKDILPKVFLYSLSHETDILQIYSAFCEEMKLKLIPFNTISESGFLIGLKPEKVLLDGAEVNVIVAVSPKTICKANDYGAIFGPQVVLN